MRWAEFGIWGAWLPVPIRPFPSCGASGTVAWSLPCCGVSVISLLHRAGAELREIPAWGSGCALVRLNRRTTLLVTAFEVMKEFQCMRWAFLHRGPHFPSRKGKPTARNAIVLLFGPQRAEWECAKPRCALHATRGGKWGCGVRGRSEGWMFKEKTLLWLQSRK